MTGALRIRFVLATATVLAFAGGCSAPRVARPGQDCGSPVPDRAVSPAGWFSFAHSHNDYEQPRPLADALAARFYSLEADIWLSGGEIRVGHASDALKGTLQELYLDPLQGLVSAHGSVYGDGVPVSLWICFKDRNPALRPALQQLLERYSMLTSFSATEMTPGAVTVVLTGEPAQKEAFVAEYTPRKACRDSNDFSPDDPPADTAWRFYALDWSVYLGWNGVGAPPVEVAARLQCILHNAHQLGRAVRLYATPETEEYWTLALDVGVDFINTDQLQKLHAFLGSRG